MNPYQSVIRLLATRPWGRFRGFEILKIAIKNADNNVLSTKWIMFSSDECHEADDLSNSPFGFIQILNTLSEKDYIFGRSHLFYAARLFGANVPPDRLFLASESLSHVHYDSILLLEHLFGESLSSPDLPRGVIPLVEAETGGIPGHVGCSQPTSTRSFTDDEMDWVRLVVPSITKFVMEERDSCDPQGGEWTNTYDIHLNEANSCSSLSQALTVSISYNMGIENGGLWDRDQKWRWFR
jgi:hypothetical protein